MERLYAAVDTLLEETCQGLNHPKCVRNAAKKSGLVLPKPEADEITEKIVSLFRTKCEERVAELIRGAEIERKLSDLRKLTELCKKKNEGLGIADGYRPLTPKKDLQGPIHSVLYCYHKSLSSAVASSQEDVEAARESLKNATERVNTLADIAESFMNDS